jgi:hypothetical protein
MLVDKPKMSLTNFKELINIKKNKYEKDNSFRIE